LSFRTPSRPVMSPGRGLRHPSLPVRRPLPGRLLAAGLAAGVLLTLPAVPAGAQAARKPITQDVYDIWRGILSPTMSRDGAWAAWTNSPGIGEGELVVRATAGSAEFKLPRGFTGRPNDRA